jgi:hypothetical protein
LLVFLVLGLLIALGFQNCASIPSADVDPSNAVFKKGHDLGSQQGFFSFRNKSSSNLAEAPKTVSQLQERSDFFNKTALSSAGKIKLSASADSFDMYNFKLQIQKDSSKSTSFAMNFRSDQLISKLVLENGIRMSLMEVKLKNLQETLEKNQVPLLLQWQQEADLQTLRFGGFQSGAFLQGLSLFLKFKPVDQQHYAVSLLDDQGNSFFSDLKFKIY